MSVRKYVPKCSYIESNSNCLLLNILFLLLFLYFIFIYLILFKKNKAIAFILSVNQLVTWYSKLDFSMSARLALNRSTEKGI